MIGQRGCIGLGPVEAQPEGVKPRSASQQS